MIGDNSTLVELFVFHEIHLLKELKREKGTQRNGKIVMATFRLTFFPVFFC